MKFIDLTGQQFGRLKVIRLNKEKSKPGQIQWVCVCECSPEKEITIHGGNLRNGHTRSCGCLSKETTKKVRTTHGMTNSTEYRIWNTIRARCYNEKDEAYPQYGGRGIVMSDEWKDSFETFYKDMGPRPSLKHSVDREKNDQGYCKENCRWATWIEQANNRKDNIFFTYRGVSKTLATWCRELQLDYQYVYRRIQNGLTLEEIVKNKP